MFRKSVKAAVMLVPLLGIPNIMQTIPFTPTNENINYFAVYTYIASILYMFQVQSLTSDTRQTENMMYCRVS